MSSILNAEQSLRDGDPTAALGSLQVQVRAHPNDAKLRIFLFQLLSVLGQWERALTQLNVAAELDPAALAMAQTYREALRCEALRAQVFDGKKSPMVFGEPEIWLALLIEALLRAGRGEHEQAQQLTRQALEEAATSSGILNDKPFSWIADADLRLGPVLEAIINGRYYWVPFARLSRIDMEAPVDLRDVVWMPAHLQFANGGESVALIPTRYPGSEASDDGLILLARKTLWNEPVPAVYHGLGQRMLTTDAGEVPLMEVRSISIDAAPHPTEQTATT
ncbi:MAG: type VI secretion system accessory protein TagJ [Gammaproteobacteria bacterium]